MRSIHLLQAGLAPVTREATAGFRELAGQAVRDALEHPGSPLKPTLLVAGSMLSGVLGHQQQLAALLADEAGLTDVEAITVEAACASGGAAALTAFRALQSGACDIALIVGAERMSHVAVSTATRGLAMASDWDREGAHGATFVSLNAALMREWLTRYGRKAEELAPFPVLAHANAQTAPHACFRKALSVEDYCSSRVLDPPLRLLDASPICDGAAALLAVAETESTRPLLEQGIPIRVSGMASQVDTLAQKDRKDLLALRAAAGSMRRALAMAGRDVRDLDLLEVHDAYSIMAALALEVCGVSAPGQSVDDAAAGRFRLDGELPIATFGGLKARGHPVGATGVYQLAEAMLQLQSRAGDNQVRGARTAATQNIGGVGTTVTSFILERT